MEDTKAQARSEAAEILKDAVAALDTPAPEAASPPAIPPEEITGARYGASTTAYLPQGEKKA